MTPTSTPFSEVLATVVAPTLGASGFPSAGNGTLGGGSSPPGDYLVLMLLTGLGTVLLALGHWRWRAAETVAPVPICPPAAPGRGFVSTALPGAVQPLKLTLKGRELVSRFPRWRATGTAARPEPGAPGKTRTPKRPLAPDTMPTIVDAPRFAWSSRQQERRAEEPGSRLGS